MLSYYDKHEYITIMSHCKKLLWVKQMLKKCNVGQDVMTFVSNIFKSLDAVNFEKGLHLGYSITMNARELFQKIKSVSLP